MPLYNYLHFIVSTIAVFQIPTNWPVLHFLQFPRALRTCQSTSCMTKHRYDKLLSRAAKVGQTWDDCCEIFTTIFWGNDSQFWRYDIFHKGLVQPPTIGMVVSTSPVFGVFLLAWDGERIYKTSMFKGPVWRAYSGQLWWLPETGDWLQIPFAAKQRNNKNKSDLWTRMWYVD